LPIVDEVYTVLRRVRGLDRELLRRYSDFLRAHEHRLSAPERFVLRRLEGSTDLPRGTQLAELNISRYLDAGRPLRVSQVTPSGISKRVTPSGISKRVTPFGYLEASHPFGYLEASHPFGYLEASQRMLAGGKTD
jgi:hypothetical protein